MTEDVKDQQADDEELTLLKARAKQMGIKHHWNIGKEKLRDTINKALADESEAKTETVPTPSQTKDKGTQSLNKRLLEAARCIPIADINKLSSKQDAARLVRIRVNCMNPNKAEWEGEIFTVSNAKMGFKKYVPFNNDEGWHVPYMIYTHLKERKCQIFVTKTDERGNKTRAGKLISEFAIELMDPLTQHELEELAQRQAMANGTAA